MTFKTMAIALASSLAIAICATTAWAVETPTSETTAAYAEKGDKACLRCHDEAPYNLILKTKHGVKGDPRTPAANHGCESCHGASPEHIATKGKSAKPAVVFSGPDASPADVRNQACQACHKGGERMKWRGSQHEANEVACNNCHTVHADKDPVLSKATEFEKCFTCHSEQRAESFQISHHPVREGKVGCSDCHNTHGSPGPKLVKGFRINDTCYECHAEKRGPYLWEHQPVRENCDNCHAPHGSTQRAMLTERMPFLCSSCHSGHSEASGGIFAGRGSLPGRNGGAVPSSEGLVLSSRSCVSCHSKVHGSNSAAGEGFFR